MTGEYYLISARLRAGALMREIDPRARTPFLTIYYKQCPLFALSCDARQRSLDSTKNR